MTIFDACNPILADIPDILYRESFPMGVILDRCYRELLPIAVIPNIVYRVSIPIPMGVIPDIFNRASILGFFRMDPRLLLAGMTEGESTTRNVFIRNGMTNKAENFSIQIVIRMLFRYESNPQANPNHGMTT